MRKVPDKLTNHSSISDKVADHLLKYLTEGNEVDRCYAAKTLGNLKSKKAISALLERMRDEDIDVCIDAVTALGKIREPSTLPMLIESLEKDPDGEIKLAVTESLACFVNKDLNSQQATELLIKIAQDRPEDMAFDENDDWDSWWDLQEKAIIILGEMRAQKAFPILKTILEDDFSQDIEPTILKAMARIGGAADDYLIKLLTTEQTSIAHLKRQRRAATALSFSSSKKTLQALGRALLSKSPDTRENAIYALGKRGSVTYLRAIILSLRDASDNVKQAALQVIQEFACHNTIENDIDLNQIAELLTKELPQIQSAVLDFLCQQQTLRPLNELLSTENIREITQCIYSTDDAVATRACQLCGLMGLRDTIRPLFNLAVSEQASPWLKKEAIMALGSLLHLADKDSRQSIIESLYPLIIHKDQTVRFSILQALLELSNHLPAQTDEEPLTPIMILLATLKGERFELLPNDAQCQQPQLYQNSQCSTCAQSDNCSVPSKDEAETAQQILQQFEQNDISSGNRLIPANETQAAAPAMSTLEAITMDNIESARTVTPKSPEQVSHDPETGPYISESLEPEMDEFVHIMRQNFSTGKRLIRRKTDTWADARHSSARLLAQNSHPDYDKLIVHALTEALNDNDEQLRLEACEALAQIALKNPLIPGLNNTFGKLVTLLDSSDRDMRLACIHALSWSGSPASLIHLLNCLSDEDYLVRIHAINGLVYIVSNQAGLSLQQRQALMNLEEVSTDQVIIALYDRLKDPHYSVAMSAVEGLVTLEKTESIDHFIDVALMDEGQLARRISALLKKLDTTKSANLLLMRLDSVNDSSYRRYIMEMLEVLLCDDKKKLAA